MLRVNEKVMNRQNLQEFLVRNESEKTQEQFAHILEVNQDEQFHVRQVEIDGSEYNVVFGGHFNVRCRQRMGTYRATGSIDDCIDTVMNLFNDPEIAQEIAQAPLVWEDGEIQPTAERVQTAIVRDDMDVVPIFIAGFSFILCTTVVRYNGKRVKLRKTTAVKHFPCR